MTHDYKRNGVTTLFAAMNILDGSVIGQCQTNHRHQEWLSFLRKIDRNTPKDKELHLIADNYATHKHPELQHGLPSTRDSTCISRPLVPLGSTWSNASFVTFHRTSDLR